MRSFNLRDLLTMQNSISREQLTWKLKVNKKKNNLKVILSMAREKDKNSLFIKLEKEIK